MPIYEFHCQRCEADFEELTSWAALSEVTCRHCGSRRVERQLSAFAVGRESGPGTSGAWEPGPCGSCGAPERGSCGND